jgi:hypothetical protein
MKARTTRGGFKIIQILHGICKIIDESRNPLRVILIGSGTYDRKLGQITDHKMFCIHPISRNCQQQGTFKDGI